MLRLLNQEMFGWSRVEGTLSEIEARNILLPGQVEYAVILAEGVSKAVGEERVGLCEGVQGLAQDADDPLIRVVDYLRPREKNKRNRVRRSTETNKQ